MNRMSEVLGPPLTCAAILQALPAMHLLGFWLHDSTVCLVCSSTALSVVDIDVLVVSVIP